LPPGQTSELLAKLELFARRHRFTFSTDSISSSTGTSTHFSLRRNDLRIEGLNPLQEDTEIRVSPDGQPEAVMRIDEGKFEIGFFSLNSTRHTDAELDALVLDLIATVQTVEGATASERTSSP